MSDDSLTRRRVSRPVAFARDASRAVSALVRDSIALGVGARDEHEAVATVGRVLAIARKPKHRAPMELLDRGEITAERGLAGNSYARPGRRQVTVVAREGWEAACRDLGREVPWTVRRANLLVEGLTLTRRVGARIALGDVLLEITGETTPCSRMDEQVPGLTAALDSDWRAGVTCRVLRGGAVQVEDVARLEEPTR